MPSFGELVSHWFSLKSYFYFNNPKLDGAAVSQKKEGIENFAYLLQKQFQENLIWLSWQFFPA